MLSLRGLAAVSLVLVLYISQASAQVSPAVRFTSRNWTLTDPKQGEVFVFGDRMLADDEEDFSHLACQYLYLESNEYRRYSCNVTMESWLLPNDTHSYTCKNILLTYEGKEIFVFFFKATVWPLTSNRVIISSDVDHSNYTTQLMIYDMQKCSIITKFRVTNASYLLMVYSDSFEVIVSNSEMCKEQSETCVIAYDFEGQPISDPRPIKSDRIALVFPAASGTSEKGYYSFSRNNMSLNSSVYLHTMTYLDPSGQAKALTFDIPMDTKFPKLPSFSNAHERFAMCWQYPLEYIYLSGDLIRFSRQVRCAQFDSQGLRLNVTLELPHLTLWVGVRNLAEGELLVATVDCEITRSFLGNEAMCKGIRVQRIASDGKQRYETLVVDGLESSAHHLTNYKMRITEDSGGEFCFIWKRTLDTYSGTDLRLEKSCIPANSTLIPRQDELKD